MGAPDLENLSPLQVIHISERHTRTILVSLQCGPEIEASIDRLMVRYKDFPRPRVVVSDHYRGQEPVEICDQCTQLRSNDG